MVLYTELPCDCAVPEWNGCYDITEDIAQGYSKIQPDGMWWRCPGKTKSYFKSHKLKGCCIGGCI